MIKSSSINQSYTMIGELYGNIGLLDCLRVIEMKNFNEIQFALVTHQKATMEHADVLYGVTMPEQGVSKVLSLRLGDEFKLD